MLPKLGFSLESKYALPTAQVIALLRRAGFSALSPVWTNFDDMSAISKYAKQQNMFLQSLHAPPKDIDLLWQPQSPESKSMQAAMLESLNACARLQIPTLVVHGWQGLAYTFPDTPLDFSFFDKLVATARQLGVAIAFENLEGEEYLAALLARYRNEPHVGYCWDSGHNHCYPHKLDFLREFGDRLIMTHLNDNMGFRGEGGKPVSRDDMHILPYDGIIDWPRQFQRLKTARRQEILNFEIKTVSHRLPTYPQWTLEQLIAEAGNRARRIAEGYAALQP